MLSPPPQPPNLGRTALGSGPQLLACFSFFVWSWGSPNLLSLQALEVRKAAGQSRTSLLVPDQPAQGPLQGKKGGGPLGPWVGLKL